MNDYLSKPYITIDDDDRERREELHALIDASRAGYQSEEYCRGRSAEDAGGLKQAMKHFANVIKHGDHLDAADLYEKIRQQLA